MQRSEGIDMFRALMALFVVVLHSIPMAPAFQFSILIMVCRAAVPFFLITSGYFIPAPAHGKIEFNSLTRPLFKLVPIYLFWMIIYYSIAKITGVAGLKLGLMDLLSGGTAFHLWYLPAAGISLVIVPVGISVIGFRATALICAALAVLALALGPYHDILNLSGNPRRGALLLAPSFVVLGYSFALYKAKISPSMAIFVLLVGLGLIIIEELAISKTTNFRVTSHDFLMSTYIYGVGVFLLALSIANCRISGYFAKFGALSLGIYVTQLVFLWGFRAIINVNTMGDVAILASCAFVCAAALTAALRHFRIFRPIIG